jgi:hypothetical protein
MPWDRLEALNGQLFLLAGVLLAGVALYKGVGAFTSTSVPPAVDTLYGGLGLLAPVVALYGLFPALRESASRLSLVGLVSATLSALFVFVMWGWFLGTTFQLGRFPQIPEEAPIWAALALIGNFLTISIAFLLLGIGSLRANSLPVPGGVLLLIPGLMWLALLLNIPLRIVPELDFFVYVINAVSVFAVGYLLVSRDQPVGGTQAPDETAS